jgi:uncharacterized Zn-binding protein involved in type VI secretion
MMPSTVFANGMGLSHEKSGGVSTVFPDVCKTPSPGGPVPVPYPNVGKSSDTTNGSTTVKIEGGQTMLQGSTYKISSGDEAGSVGGVVSGKVKGACEFTLYSFDVKIEGKSVCRMGDMLTHNDKNTAG